ncbi:flagellar hook-associated protein FlgL [Anaeroselena agilis]|uniref:Flagellar hook-associated protein FlgL n=1 Tax=Anaeroselena agilis TaxID=3063788 RepID=A0ABU3NZB7_9FIRM|nr:flagellar hook-associated protein FlgL [Selenomonadales bacterium 4137-cl]
MRITNNMMVTSTIRNINAAASRLNEASERVSTELKISLPSDDPVVATKTIKYRDYVAKIEQYQSNASAADSWMSTTDDALSELYDYVAAVKDDISKACTAEATTSDWADIKEEVMAYLEGIVQVVNADYGGRYIFGGFSVSEAPYELVERMATNISSAAYDTGDFSLAGDLAAGSYTMTVTESGGTYTVTMTDGTNTYTGTTDSSTGTVELKTADGQVMATLTAPAGGLASASFTFDATECVAVKYKGQYLSTVLADTVDAATMQAMYSGNTYVDSGSDQSIKYNLGYGADVTVNTEGQDVVGDSAANLFNTLTKLLLALSADGTTGGATYQSYDTGTDTVTTGTIGTTDELLDDINADIERLTTAQASLGARETYVANVSDRLANDYTNYTTLLSDTIDVDVSEALIEQTTAETVYEAALSVGAKAISKTLVDYTA